MLESALASPIPPTAVAPDARPLISVVVPVKNEEGNVAPLIAEIAAALDAAEAQDPTLTYEIVYVDDGSTDTTPTILANLRGAYPNLRQLRHATSGGQSAAIRSGVRAARGSFIATLDGDGQNNPAFIPQMIQILKAGVIAQPGGDTQAANTSSTGNTSWPDLASVDAFRVGIVQGQRVGRKDTPFKRWQSRQANRIRGAILQDGTRDTGCGLKAFPRAVYLALPYFDAIHRFMPALVKREGLQVAHLDVVDRPRHSGVSNYGFWGRLWVGVLDLVGVWWLIRRKKPTPDVKEIV